MKITMIELVLPTNSFCKIENLTVMNDESIHVPLMYRVLDLTGLRNSLKLKTIVIPQNYETKKKKITLLNLHCQKNLRFIGLTV